MIQRNESLNKSLTFFNKKNYPIPSLILLNDMVECIKKAKILPDLSKTVFIGVQHILETTVTLFDALIELGIKPEYMYFSGKCYSSAPEIVEQMHKRKIKLMESNISEEIGQYEKYCLQGITKMWEQCIKEIKNHSIDQIIILDEGGRCLEMMPASVRLRYTVAAIEQTRAGLYSHTLYADQLVFPLVEVASCAVKKILEPPLIAEAVVNRLDKLILKLNPDIENTVFGIVGNGAIGNALAKHLLAKNYTVLCYDEDTNTFKDNVDKNFYRVASITSVIANADIILGCTGKDITEKLDIFNIIKKDKILVSCTSEDKEFRSLIRKIGEKIKPEIDILSDITYLNENGSKINILQGGFPFNFDRKPWNVPAQDIEVTQGLLLGGCVQAIICATKPVGNGITINNGARQALDPFIQSYVALHWLARRQLNEYPDICQELFKTPTWILKNSGGRHYENKAIGNCFEQNIAKKSAKL